MADKVKVAVLLSGRGSNMLALSEHKRRDPDRPYEIALVASNVPEARGLVLARRLGHPTWSLSQKGFERDEFDSMLNEAQQARDIERLVTHGAAVGLQAGQLVEVVVDVDARRVRLSYPLRRISRWMPR